MIPWPSVLCEESFEDIADGLKFWKARLIARFPRSLRSDPLATRTREAATERRTDLAHYRGAPLSGRSGL